MRSGGTIEKSLVAAARAGDRHAVDELVTASLPLVYAVVRQALDEHDDVDDIVQDVMLRALRQLPTLRKVDSFRQWLTAIAVNQISTHLHRRDLGARRFAGLDEAGAVPDPGLEIESVTTLQADLSAQRRQVARAGVWLDPDDRVLLSLWLLETAGELTRADVAAALGAGVAHTGVRIQRMRRQLDASRELVAALSARPRCAGLDAAMAGWDGVPAPLWRKRLVRHTRSCDVCRRSVSDIIPAERLLPGFALLLPAPIGLSAAVLAKAAVGKAALGQAALGQAALGEVALGQAALGQAALGNAALGQAALGQAALGQAALGQAALNHAVLGQVAAAAAPAAASSSSAGLAGASAGAGVFGSLLQSVAAHPIAASVAAAALAAGAGVGATTYSTARPSAPVIIAAPVSPDPPASPAPQTSPGLRASPDQRASSGPPGTPSGAPETPSGAPASRPSEAAATTPGRPVAPGTVSLAPGQPVSLEPADQPGRYVTTAADLGVLVPADRGSDDATRRGATFTAVTGLADSGCFSFRAPDGRYLRHASWRLRLDPDQATPLFRGDATFCPRAAGTGGAVSLEASNYPGWFVHHRENEVWVDQAEASTFWIRAPLAD